MSFPSNVFQNVQTWQRSGLALLENTSPLINMADKRFQNFQTRTANLGSTILFDLPPRFTTNNGLVVTFQDLDQRTLNLTCDQSSNTSFAYSSQDLLFNVREYMDRFGSSAIEEFGSNMERNLGLYITGTASVNNVVNGQTVPTGNYHTESGPYRFFGDGVTPINSYKQLSQSVANFKDFGCPSNSRLEGILPITMIPNIIDTGLNQFTLERGNETAKSWQLGSFSGAKWYESNLLPTHTSGNVGQDGSTLTVISTNDPTGQNVTQITCSGAGVSDADAVKNGDLGQIQGDIRFLTFTGHAPSQQPVQFRITANTESNGSGNVVLNIFPGMCWQHGNKNENVTQPIIAGMTIKLVPSHKRGVLVAGKAFFLSMPMMPDTMPFPSGIKNDQTTGASMRLYYGNLIGQNQYGMIYDQAWSGVIVPEYSMAYVIPL